MPPRKNARDPGLAVAQGFALAGRQSPRFDTYCICGDHRWPGRVGTWHSVARYEPDHTPTASRGIGNGSPGHCPPRVLIGWDTYFMHTDGCGDRDTDDVHGIDDVTTGHLCGAVDPANADTRTEETP